MKKILNTPTVQQTLKCSFAIAVIAGKLSVPTASAEEIIIDFKGGKITEGTISKRLREENEKKIRVYEQLTKKFKQCTEDFQKPLQTLKKTSNNDSLEDLIESFVAVVPGGKALGKAKRNMPSQNTCTLFPSQDTSRDAFEDWREMRIRFLSALSILETWIKQESDGGNSALKNARANLHRAGEQFFIKISPLFGEFDSSELSKECRKRLKATQKAQMEELVLKITLKEGTVDPETSGQLFKNLNEGLYLTFDHIEGTLVADEVLNKRLISIAFLNSKLELEARCFQESKFLERLSFKNSIVTMGYLCFAKCKHLQSPEYENLLLYFPFPSNLMNVFEDDPCIDKKFIQEMATNCFRERCKRGAFEKEDDVNDYLMCNKLDLILTEFYRRCEIEKQNSELKKQLEVYEEAQKQLEKRNGDLERANKNHSNETAALLQKYRTVKTELKTTEGKLSVESDKFLKVSAEYENYKKQQTETVEKLEQELKKERDYTEAKRIEVLKVIDANKDLRKKLDDLETGRETQEEEIEKLRTLAEEWKDKIDKVSTLEVKNEQLEEQLNKETKDRITAEWRLVLKCKQCDEYEVRLRGKNNTINRLEKDLKDTLLESTKLRARIKELETSEAYGIRQGEEEPKKKVKEPKKEVKNDDFRQKKEPFYPKKKGKFVPFNPKGCNF